MTPADQIRLLEAEYFKLQDIIESFDAKALQFKGWSVTVTLAAAATALLSEKIDDDKRMMVLALAAFGSLVFWLTEAMWKLFQQAFFKRLRAIETSFEAAEQDTLRPLQINRTWKESYQSERLANFWKYALKPNTMLPHVAVTAFCVVLIGWLYADDLRAAHRPLRTQPGMSSASSSHQIPSGIQNTRPMPNNQIVSQPRP